MKQHRILGLMVGLLVMLSGAWFLYADDPTSKFVPLAPIASTLAPSSTGLAVQFEIWDQAAGGALIYAEAHTVDTDASSNIANDTKFADLLLGRPDGLGAANFPFGSSRYLDVTQGGVSVLTDRLPLYASVFSLTDPGSIEGNLTMVNSTATAGNLLKGGVPFLHNYGSSNTFLGLNSGNFTMTGGNNTASGYSALGSNTTGSNNTAIGAGPLTNNTSGSSNTAIGFNAMQSNTEGHENTALGGGALTTNTEGRNNTASGFRALGANRMGSNNTASGWGALQSNTIGSNNTALGAGADVAAPGLTNATAIGAGAIVGQSNSLVLGNNANVGIGTTVPNEKLVVQTATANYGLVHTDGDVMVGSWVGAGSAGSKGGWFGTKSNHPLRFFANSGGASMTIDTNGNVGIGTLFPSAVLHVVTPLPGGSSSHLTYREGELTIESIRLFPLPRLDIPKFKIAQNGNVGIGTATPRNQLEIRGANNALALGDIGCGAGIGAIAPMGCSNYQFLGQGNGGTFINSFGQGAIHFRHNNSEADQMTINTNGTVSVKVLQITGGSDFSEKFEVRSAQKSIEPGMVVTIDPENPGKLIVSTKAYDRRVAGIISGAGGVQPGMMMGQTGTLADGDHPVALTGRVYVRADASNGTIVPGDLLTTSNIPGHAMKVTNYNKAQGAIIGKAMTGLAKGTGLVLVLVTLQ